MTSGIRTGGQKVYFTLVELMVVITIIIVLISLLVPAFKSARDSSRRIACLNNQKQFVIAFCSYNNDFNSFYPHYGPYGTVSPSTDGGWVSLLYKENYLSNSGIFCCPASSKKTSDYLALCKSRGMEYANYFISYGYNFRWIGSSFRLTSPNDVSSSPARTGNIKNPSKIVLLTDAGYSNTQFSRGAYLVDDHKSGREEVDPWTHNKGLNISWCDGHVTFNKMKNPLNPYLINSGDFSTSSAADSLWKR